jgi:hypothetical protein
MMCGPTAKPLLQRLRFAIIEHIQHDIVLAVQDHCHVLVPLLEGGLVNPDVLQRPFLPPSQPPRDRPLLNPRRLIPTQPQHPGNRGNRRLFQPIDHQRFKESC